MLSPKLKSQINQLWDKFWSRGLSNPIQAIEQISYLLFMKRLDETDELEKAKATFAETEYESIFKDHPEFRWSQFKDIPDPEEMLKIVRDGAFPFIKGLNLPDQPYSRYMKDAVFQINTPALLDEAIKSIDEIYKSIKDEQDEGQAFQDTLGDVYEYLLNQLSQAGKNGQFRTPRHIIQLICEIVEPDWTNKVCDPAAGTAGFLLAAYQHIVTKYTSKKDQKIDENGFTRGVLGNKLKKKEVWAKLKENTFFGFDIDRTMVRMGLMNLMLHNITIPKIEHLDTLSKRYDDYEPDEQYSVVMANPPFTGRIDKGGMSEKFRITGTQSELLFIDRIIHMLEPGGKGALIVPEGVLFGTSKAQKMTREFLLKDCQLEAVISLPSGVFKPYTGVKTAILFFKKVELYSKTFSTQKVWFYELEHDGFSLDDNRKPLKEKPLPGLVNLFKNRNSQISEDRKGKYFFVPIEEIEENDFDLSFNRYKEFVYEEQEFEPPHKILSKVIELEKEILEEMNELKEMI